jgi:5-methylcytosine-specific restriction endonuclease McrA
MKTCSVEGCGKKHKSRGLCNAHYSAWRLENIPGARESALEAQRRSDARRYHRPDRREAMRAANRESRKRARLGPDREDLLLADRVASSCRRALSRSAEGAYSVADWVVVLAHHGGVCAKCGAAEQITVDHILPLALGGSNWPRNLQPLCLHCNSTKRHLESTEYFQGLEVHGCHQAQENKSR